MTTQVLKPQPLHPVHMGTYVYILLIFTENVIETNEKVTSVRATYKTHVSS